MARDNCDKSDVLRLRSVGLRPWIIVGTVTPAAGVPLRNLARRRPYTVRSEIGSVGCRNNESGNRPVATADQPQKRDRGQDEQPNLACEEE